MSDEEESDVENMELSWRARILQPFSVGVLWILEWVESDKVYFEDIDVEHDEEHEDTKVQMFFHAAFYDRSRWHLIPGLLLAIGFGLEIWVIPPFDVNLQLYGLAMDMIGAFILAIGLFRGIEAIKRDTQMREAVWGSHYDTDSLSAIARDTVDGLYGAVYLIGGFLLQFIAVSHVI